MEVAKGSEKLVIWKGRGRQEWPWREVQGGCCVDNFTTILTLPSNKDWLCASDKPPSLSEPLSSSSAGGDQLPCSLSSHRTEDRWPWEAWTPRVFSAWTLSCDSWDLLLQAEMVGSPGLWSSHECLSTHLQRIFLTFSNHSFHWLCTYYVWDHSSHFTDEEPGCRERKWPAWDHTAREESEPDATLMWLIPKLLLLLFCPCHVKELWLVSPGVRRREMGAPSGLSVCQALTPWMRLPGHPQNE